MALYGFRCRKCGRYSEIQAPIQEGPGAPPFCCNDYMRRDFGRTMINANPVAIREENRVTDADRRHQSADMARYEQSYSRPEADPTLAQIH